MVVSTSCDTKAASFVAPVIDTGTLVVYAPKRAPACAMRHWKLCTPPAVGVTLKENVPLALTATGPARSTRFKPQRVLSAAFSLARYCVPTAHAVVPVFFMVTVTA